MTEQNPLRLALIGLPGSGKTTVGRPRARRLNQPVLDSDQVIEQRLDCSIRDYFATEGEERFRDVEQQVIDELTLSHAGLLSTGGGVVLRSANRAHLRERTHVVYLRSSPEELFRRLRHDQSRPLLQREPRAGGRSAAAPARPERGARPAVPRDRALRGRDRTPLAGDAGQHGRDAVGVVGTGLSVLAPRPLQTDPGNSQSSDTVIAR